MLVSGFGDMWYVIYDILYMIYKVRSVGLLIVCLVEL